MHVLNESELLKFPLIFGKHINILRRGFFICWITLHQHQFFQVGNCEKKKIHMYPIYRYFYIVYQR